MVMRRMFVLVNSCSTLHASQADQVIGNMIQIWSIQMTSVTLVQETRMATLLTAWLLNLQRRPNVKSNSTGMRTAMHLKVTHAKEHSISPTHVTLTPLSTATKDSRTKMVTSLSVALLKEQRKKIASSWLNTLRNVKLSRRNAKISRTRKKRQPLRLPTE